MHTLDSSTTGSPPASISSPLATLTALIVSASLLAPASTVLAGLVGGGGTHDWTGAVSSNWNLAGNWSTNQVPGNDAAAIVLGGAPFVTLSADSASLRTLFIGGGRTVSNNGHLLRVLSNDATTTVAGVDSQLFVTGAGVGFQTDSLSIESSGRLTMSGGTAQIGQQLTLDSGGRLLGYGTVIVDSPAPAALNALDGGILSVSSGDLTIEVIGGGSMVLPDLVEVLQPGRRLTLDGPFFLDPQNIHLGEECILEVVNDWTLAGELRGTANAALVANGGNLTVEGIVRAEAGVLRFATPAYFTGTSEIIVAPGDTIEFDALHTATVGNVATIGFNGRMRVDGTQQLGVPWRGAISLNGGILEANTGSGLWITDAPLTLGSLGGIRSRIAGSAWTRATDLVIAPGLGGVVESTLELMLDATMQLAQPQTRLIVEGTLRLHDSTTTGLGAIEVEDGGRIFAAPGAAIGVDIVNGGAFHLGTTEGATGSIYVNSDYTQMESGELVVDLTGPDLIDRDFFEFTGAVDLGGTLAVSLTEDFEPTIGDSYTILYGGGGVLGTFDSIVGAEGFSVAYLPTSVVLTYQGSIFGDLNGDGVVDGADLGILLGSWGACVECAGCIADLDGNCEVDGADLGLILGAWSETK